MIKVLAGFRETFVMAPENSLRANIVLFQAHTLATVNKRIQRACEWYGRELTETEVAFELPGQRQKQQEKMAFSTYQADENLLIITEF